MDLNYIKKLIKMLDTSTISEIEIEEQGTRLRLSKPRPKFTTPSNPLPFTPVPTDNSGIVSSLTLTSPPVSDSGAETEQIQKSPDDYFEVRSPMVGTFYRAPAPDAGPYVKIGDSVSSGTVLCIIEAMKLMNEIESEVSGKIVKILVENAQAVEYNQPLFLVDKT